MPQIENRIITPPVRIHISNVLWSVVGFGETHSLYRVNERDKREAYSFVIDGQYTPEAGEELPTSLRMEFQFNKFELREMFLSAYNNPNFNFFARMFCRAAAWFL